MLSLTTGPPEGQGRPRRRGLDKEVNKLESLFWVGMDAALGSYPPGPLQEGMCVRVCIYTYVYTCTYIDFSCSALSCFPAVRSAMKASVPLCTAADEAFGLPCMSLCPDVKPRMEYYQEALEMFEKGLEKESDAQRALARRNRAF